MSNDLVVESQDAEARLVTQQLTKLLNQTLLVFILPEWRDIEGQSLGQLGNLAVSIRSVPLDFGAFDFHVFSSVVE